MSTNPVSDYGFTAVLADASKVKQDAAFANRNEAPPIASSATAPATPLAKRIQAFAKDELNPATFNHSMRVYHYGLAIARSQFPHWAIEAGSRLEETYFLTCMLHDIGTTERHMAETQLSFEFHGAWVAYQEMIRGERGQGKASGGVAPTEQAESVVEAIIRHQDICTTGKITLLGQLIQLATTFDNMGLHKELVNMGTVEEVCKKWPRLKWNGCFSQTIRKEQSLKPWCHSTALGEDEFPDGVANNKLMEPFD